MRLFGSSYEDIHEKGLGFASGKSGQSLTAREIVNLLSPKDIDHGSIDHILEDALLWSVAFVGVGEETDMRSAIHRLMTRIDEGSYLYERAGEILQDFDYLNGKTDHIDVLLRILRADVEDLPNEETPTSAEWYLVTWLKSGRADIHPMKESVQEALEERRRMDAKEVQDRQGGGVLRALFGE